MKSEGRSPKSEGRAHLIFAKSFQAAQICNPRYRLANLDKGRQEYFQRTLVTRDKRIQSWGGVPVLDY